MNEDQYRDLNRLMARIQAIAWTILALASLSIIGAMIQRAADVAAVGRGLGDIQRRIMVIENQNHWSIEDRAELHESQGQVRASLERLEGFVDQVRDAEKKRREAREKAQR